MKDRSLSIVAIGGGTGLSRLLRGIKQYSQTHRLPYSYITALERIAMKRLKRAAHLLGEGEIEGTEFEIRLASEDIVRAFLLEKNIPEINPPKIYLPQLRTNLPSIHSLFAKIHNLEEIRRIDVELAILKCSKWIKEIDSSITKIRFKEIMQNARKELENATDCLSSGDLEAGIMQARYSAIISMPLVDSSMDEIRNDIMKYPLSHQYTKLAEIENTYTKMLRDVMNLFSNKKMLKDHIKVLRNIIEKHNLL